MALPLYGEVSQSPEPNLSNDHLDELDGIMTHLYYRDSLTAERLKGSPVELKSPTPNLIRMRLERLGGSVTLLCLWDDNDDFVYARRTVRAGKNITERHDFTPSEVTPVIMQEFRDVNDAVKKLHNPSPAWRGPWADWRS